MNVVATKHDNVVMATNSIMMSSEMVRTTWIAKSSSSVMSNAMRIAVRSR